MYNNLVGADIWINIYSSIVFKITFSYIHWKIILFMFLSKEDTKYSDKASLTRVSCACFIYSFGPPVYYTELCNHSRNNEKQYTVELCTLLQTRDLHSSTCSSKLLLYKLFLYYLFIYYFLLNVHMSVFWTSLSISSLQSKTQP